MAVDPEPDEALIAAAEAAASWAHARRSKWTNRPLPTPAPPPRKAAPPPKAVAPPPPPVIEEPFEFEFEPQPAPPSSTSAPPPPIVAPPPAAAPRSPARPRKSAVRQLGEPIKRWAPRIGAAAALIAAAAALAPYAVAALSSLKERAATATAPAPKPRPPTAAPRKTGTLSVTSTPPGAQVIVDGKPRGVTPLELTDVAPGRHEVALKSTDGSVRRTVTVATDKTVTIEEAIFSGWVSVLSPFEITIAEGGRVLRPDERNQVMLPPGPHVLRFTNKVLGYDMVRDVEVKPGEAATVRLTPEPSKLSVTATEPAEVFVDGARVGQVPLNGAGVALGTHEIVVRRLSDGTERRSTVTIGVAPFALHVDFSQPGG